MYWRQEKKSLCPVLSVLKYIWHYKTISYKWNPPPKEMNALPLTKNKKKKGLYCFSIKKYLITESCYKHVWLLSRSSVFNRLFLSEPEQCVLLDNYDNHLNPPDKGMSISCPGQTAICLIWVIQI